MKLSFFVPGDPKGQPRPRAFAAGGRVRVYDPGTAEHWKSCVAVAYRDTYSTRTIQPADGMCVVHLAFRFARPGNHYRSGKHAGELKSTAPQDHTSKPDLDNLVKAVLDALTSMRLWHDDSQVSFLEASKIYCQHGDEPGCHIMVVTKEKTAVCIPNCSTQ